MIKSVRTKSSTQNLTWLYLFYGGTLCIGIVTIVYISYEILAGSFVDILSDFPTESEIIVQNIFFFSIIIASLAVSSGIFIKWTENIKKFRRLLLSIVVPIGGVVFFIGYTIMFLILYLFISTSYYS